jgi:hypothetical protein
VIGPRQVQHRHAMAIGDAQRLTAPAGPRVAAVKASIRRPAHHEGAFIKCLIDSSTAEGVSREPIPV